MAAVRRLYLYAIAFVSLEVVVWGTIGLVRSLFTGAEVGSDATRLAGALSLILVGLPVFLMHWILIQRGVSQDIAERSARLRAIFLYGILAASLVPVFQNFLALINRILLGWLGSEPQQAMLGGNQQASDNLVAIGLNLIVAAYFYQKVRQDWSNPLQGDGYPEVRRLFRYLWLVYSLAYLGAGVQQIIRYILTAPTTFGNGMVTSLANGLSLLLLGIPLWVYTGRMLERAITEPGERESLIRQVTLRTIMFISLLGALASSWQILVQILQFLFGAQVSATAYLQTITQPLSMALPLAGIWLYYRRVLLQDADAIPELPQIEFLRQLYLYLLSLLGLAVTFSGLYLLLDLLIEFWAGGVLLGMPSLRSWLADALATLIVALPVWLLAWREIARSAAQPGETGERARRSLVRKSYLYFVLFASVLGLMFATGQLLFQLISALLGEPAEDLQLQILQILKTTVLSLMVLAYHWHILRKDARLTGISLSRRRVQFPVLILDPGHGNFADSLLSALKRQAPDLPVAVHPIAQGAPDETLSAAKAVLLPGGELAQLPEAGRLWLHSYPGQRLVVPSPGEGLFWIGESGRSMDSLANQAAATVLLLAEGEQVAAHRRNTWMIVVYILAALFAIQILLGLIAFFFSLITN